MPLSTPQVTALALGLFTLGLGGCANVPKVNYELYSVDDSYQEQLKSSQLGPSLGASKTDTGTIRFPATGSFVLISVAPPPAAPAGAAPGTPPKQTPTQALTENVKAAAGDPGTLTKMAEVKELQGKSFSPVPGGSTYWVVAMTPIEEFWFKPNISVAFTQNGTTLTQVGTDSVDTSTADIAAVAGIVKDVAVPLKAVGPLVHGLDQTSESKPPNEDRENLYLPYVLEFSRPGIEACIYPHYDSGTPPILIKAPATADGGCAFDDKNTTWSFWLEIRSPRSGKVLYDEFNQNGFFNGSNAAPASSREFPYAPCVRVSLHIHGPRTGLNSADMTVTNLTVADPTYVQTYLLPQKGTIAMNSVCGANLTPQSATATTGLDDLKALADAASTLKSSQPTTAAKAGTSAPKKN